MAQDSRRVRHLRRVKRERTQLRQALGHQNEQMRAMFGTLVQTQKELTALKNPSFTIETVADPDNYFPADDGGSMDATAETIGYAHTEEPHDEAPVDSNPS